MSMHALRANLAQMARLGAFAPPREGYISSYDADNYAVKVRLQPDDTETGWLPIRVAQAGAGWGIYAAPQVGDLASVEFLEGDPNVGRCTGFLPNEVDQPPSVPAGEIWIKHKAGQFVKLLSDGTVSIEATAGIHSKGPWTHDGTLHTTHDITCDTTVTATTDVIGGGKSLKNHVHNVEHVQGGAATIPTDPPT